MRRCWLGVGILVGFLIWGLVTMGIINNAQLPIGDMLEEAVEKTLSGDFNGGVTLGMEAKDRWERQWNKTATLADHSPMDDVDALFGELEIYARTGEEPHFAACCQALARRVKAIADAHKFSWWNIL